MRWNSWKRGTGAMGIVLAAALGLAQSLHGVEPRRAVTPAEGDSATLSGKMESFLKNDHGDVDGVRFRDGQVARFPPHIGREVQQVGAIGDQLEVQGRIVTRPRGETVVEAARIVVAGKTIIVNRPRPPHVPALPQAADEPMKATGTIDRFTQTPKGETDGFRLIDGTEVKFPPHQGRALRQLAEIGDQVRVEGRRHETPRGELHLHAYQIVAVSNGKSIERDEPAHRGPELRSERPESPREANVSNADILNELRALRRLLEERR